MRPGPASIAAWTGDLWLVALQRYVVLPDAGCSSAEALAAEQVEAEAIQLLSRNSLCPHKLQRSKAGLLPTSLVVPVAMDHHATSSQMTTMDVHRSHGIHNESVFRKQEWLQGSKPCSTS